VQKANLEESRDAKPQPLTSKMSRGLGCHRFCAITQSDLLFGFFCFILASIPRVRGTMKRKAGIILGGIKETSSVRKFCLPRGFLFYPDIKEF